MPRPNKKSRAARKRNASRRLSSKVQLPLETEQSNCQSQSQIGAQILSVEEGRSHCLEGLATRKHGDDTTLTTTPSTAVSSVAEVGKPLSVTPVPAGFRHTVSEQATGVQILAKLRCRRCQANQENVVRRSNTHRCERCGILQLTKCYTFTPLRLPESVAPGMEGQEEGAGLDELFAEVDDVNA